MNTNKRLKIALLAGSVLVFSASLLMLRTKELSLNLSNIFVNDSAQALITETISPTADTFIRKEYPNKNYEGLLEVINDGSPSVNSLLKFDLSNINLSEVQSVELSVTPNLSRKVKKFVKIVTSSWNSGSVTWNTAPTYGATIGTIDAEVKSDITYKYTLDLNAVKSVGSTLSIAIMDQASGYSLSFRSLETGNPGAKLVFTTKNVVTPTDPVDPTPTDPVDPTPTDPVDPTPTDPVDPTPTDPVDPEEPIDPEDPTDPVDPEEPIDPEEPVVPEPTDPEDPSEPTIPPLTPSTFLTAVINANPLTGAAPLTVSFDANSSYTASNGIIAKYTWTTGDGKTYDEKSFEHTYVSAGEYEVKLVLEDSLNRTAEISRSIIVNSSSAEKVPVITGALPIGELIYSTENVNLSIRTDIVASCKYHQTDGNFNYNTSGVQLSTSTGRHHIYPLTNLTPGSSHTYYIKCKTEAGGITPSSKVVEFSISQIPPDNEVTLQSPYGVYPNCIAPGIPVESQEWWQEDADPLPTDSDNIFTGTRHVHMGMCAPNVRNVSDTRSFGGIQDFVAVVIMHNNPAKISWISAGFQENSAGQSFKRTVTENGTKTTDWSVQTKECEGGSTSCVVFKEPVMCEGHLCTYQVPLRIDMSTCEIDGLCELRIRPNLSEVPPRNERAFTTLNFQINVGGNQKYRESSAPIGRGWYTDLDYANVSIDNYMDLFKGDYSKSIPTVSGTINLKTRHREAANGSTATFRLDASAHAGDGGTIVYEKEFSGSLNVDDLKIDTTKLTNGLHTLFLTTIEKNDVGKNIGVLRLFINVQN